MRWEHLHSDFPELPDTEIPPELLSGLERYADESTLLKVRLRWRPHESMSRGFLTKDRLVELGSASVQEIALATASYARHLYEQGECEERFEAQVRRELAQPGESGRRAREWRSITFYIDPLPSERAKQMEPEPDDEPVHEHDDDTNLDIDELDDEDTDEPVPTARPVDLRPRVRPAPPRPRVTGLPLPTSRRQAEPPHFAQYAQESELYRMDPMIYAMAVVRQTYDRVVDTFERALFVSFERLDRTLESQHSHSEFINEAMQTVTRGAGEIAGVGIDLFRAGMEHQADVAHIEHESEIGKERTELMRDAVQQGSLLAQAVLMSNAAKRRASTEQPTDEPTQRAERSEPPPSRPEPPREPTPRAQAEPAAPRPEPQRPAPAPAPTPARDGSLEAELVDFINSITPEMVDKLRVDAPNACQLLESLRSGPVTVAAARSLLNQTTLKENELLALNMHLGAALLPRLMQLGTRLAKEAP